MPVGTFAKRVWYSARFRTQRGYVLYADPLLSFWRRPPQALEVTRIQGHDDFARYSVKIAAAAERRREMERRLARDRQSFRTRGFCFVCGRWTLFSSSWAWSYEVDGRLMPNWREHLLCPRCGLNNRMRATMHLVATMANISTSSRVYLTEQTTPLFTRLSQSFPLLAGSEYLGSSVPRGMNNPAGIRNEDLTRITFETGVFDAILSFEVFEHIADFRSAFRECARVLRPGGRMLFSVPFDANSVQNQIRARVRPDGSIEHLHPPEYHGDPLNAAGCLCFQNFGWEMLDQLREDGFSSVSALLYYSRDFGYIGGGQMQFLAER